MLTPNELVFTFGGTYVCDSFGENRSRNAPWECSQTDAHTDRQTQTDFLQTVIPLPTTPEKCHRTTL